MKLIIAEKPSMGRTIASALGAKTKKDGYMEGNGYIVSWCFGHLYELQDLEWYVEPNYTKGQKVSWQNSMQYLPFFPKEWKFAYGIKKDCSEQINILGKLMNREDVDCIYAAGDADREGEVIVGLVIKEKLKSNKKVLRLWLPVLTEDSIRTAVIGAKPDSSYSDLFSAGQTRAFVDWMIGIELTRFASVKTNSFVRIGRCVCPIVSKVVERETEIKNFKPENYFSVEGKYVDGDAKIKLVASTKFTAEEEPKAHRYAREMSSRATVVDEVNTKQVKIGAHKLFSQSDLQSYVCKIDKSMNPSKVLASTQKLYEAGFVTYPRTSTNFLGVDEYDRISAIISEFERNGIIGLINKKSKSIYDDSKVESHSALTPTTKIPSETELSGNEKTVYKAIKSRFLAVFCEKPCVVNRTTYKLSNGNEKFTAKGDVMLQKGWMEFEQSSKKDVILPKLVEGQSIQVPFEAISKQTQPPKRFTVESLNAWMKSPLSNDETGHRAGYSDEEWKDILSEATICTEATRAGILDACVASKYIELKKGVYYGTTAGEFLVQVLNDLHIDLSVKKTVELSRELHDIAIGKTASISVLEETKNMLETIFGNNSELSGEKYVARGRQELGKCPRCGKPIYENAKAYSCADKCGWALWKNNKYLDAIGYKLTPARVEQLLKNGKILAKGLKSKKTGKEYDAYLVLTDDGKYAGFEMAFPKNNKKSG